MVTRRTAHANHSRSSSSSKRQEKRKSSSPKQKTLYAGGSGAGSRGGRVGNLAGLESGGMGSFNDSAPSVGNVAGLGSDGADFYAKDEGRHASSAADAPKSSSPTPRNSRSGKDGDSLISRRGFLYGAAAVGAVAVVGGGAVAATQLSSSDDEDEDISYLEVPNSAVTSSDDFTNVEVDGHMTLDASYELTYGTLVWANDDEYAACLVPTEESSPIAQVALLSLSEGSCPIVLDQAVGNDEGFEIYDVRATSSGLVWTEADILDGTWRVYTATLSGDELGSPALAKEGRTSDWDTPTIAAVGGQAFVQIVPKSDAETYDQGTSLLRVAMGSEEPEELFNSRGRSATSPYATADGVVITPRLDSSTIYHQLTLIDAESGKVSDSMTLPYSMTPLEAGYGKTGFMFSFENIYDYGDGISNLGTYAPMSAVSDGAYSKAGWFHFNRTPTAAPAWCGDYLMVKSTTQVCGFDLDAGEYFAFDTESGADDYGEYLASTGARDAIVTFTNVDDNPVNGDERTCCVVKVWKPA